MSSSAEFLVSRSSDRANPATLAGATLSGPVGVFAELQSEATRVRFYRDDRTLTGAPVTTESNSPYDCSGSASTGAASPFDTATVADGTHTITAVIERADGSVDVATASFSVDSE